jgi:energy-coupling factor transporter ATP-binding protein EcfA2
MAARQSRIIIARTPVELLKLDNFVSAAKPKAPYPGLRPFEPEEWSIFFGREEMIDDITERLATQQFVLIHGPSGSGKSSLVRAGVLPKLARQHLRHGIGWLTCDMRPSGGPLWNLASELVRLEGRQDDSDHGRTSAILQLFNSPGATLESVINTLDGLAGTRLCILVDQFEELFRFERQSSREEAELFVELLIGQIASDNARNDQTGQESGPRQTNIHIVITMRSEFLGECARFDGFAEAVNLTQYLVPRMQHDALLRAIRLPAEQYGGEVTLELAERLIMDVRDRDDELPLIQHGLMLLWNSVASTDQSGPLKLDVDQFEEAGGLTQLLSDHADSVMIMATTSANSTIGVERLFRALTDINADGVAIRRPQTFGELAAIHDNSTGDLHTIIDAFRMDGVSFLTPYFPEKIDEKTPIDISHEALIRCWNRVADPRNGWLTREFEDGLLWRTMLNSATEFEADHQRILSPAVSLQRVNWLRERTPSWSKRYGGGWSSVERLLEVSRQAAIRATRIRRLLMTPLVLIVTLMFTNEALGTLSVGFAAAGILYMSILGVLLAIEYCRQIIEYCHQVIDSEWKRTLLVWSLFIIAIGIHLAAPLWIDSSATRNVLKFFAWAATGVAGLWSVLTIGPFLVSYVPSWMKPPSPLGLFVLHLFGGEPPVYPSSPGDRASVTKAEFEPLS